MLENWTKTATHTAPLKVVIENLPPKDHAFLSTLLALFTDPANEMLAARIRAGKFAVQYEPKTGNAHIVDLELDEPHVTPGDLIAFYAGMTQEEWNKVKARYKTINKRFLRSPESARRFVSELLGRAWTPKGLPVNKG
jgi:hypothetical protein